MFSKVWLLKIRGAWISLNSSLKVTRSPSYFVCSPYWGVYCKLLLRGHSGLECSQGYIRISWAQRPATWELIQTTHSLKARIQLPLSEFLPTKKDTLLHQVKGSFWFFQEGNSLGQRLYHLHKSLGSCLKYWPLPPHLLSLYSLKLCSCGQGFSSATQGPAWRA